MVFTGCAQLPARLAPVSDEAERWAMRIQQISAIANWELRGRVAIRTADEGFSGKLMWVQNADKYRLLLVAPFGQGSYELSGDGAQVTLLAPQQTPVHAQQPEALLQSQLGWTIPVSGLRHWVLGVPEPDRPITHLTLDGQGRLSEMRQSGWQVRIERYARSADLELPTKLYLDRDSLSVRVVVQKWKSG